MRTCNNDPRPVRPELHERSAPTPLERAAAELLARPQPDRFVATPQRTAELHLTLQDRYAFGGSPQHAGGVEGGGQTDAYAAIARAHEGRLADMAELVAALTELKGGYRAWRDANPDAVEPGNGTRSLGEILDDPSLSTGETCFRIIEVIVHERPETVDELRATIPHGELPEAPAVPPAQPGEAPNTEISRGIFSAIGMGASLLGGLLSNPAAIPLLTAACTVIPGAQVLAPFIPVIAPVAGMLLSGVGGMASQVGQGQAPSLDPSGLASPDMLAQLLPAVTGMLGGAAGAPGLPIPAIPAP